MDATGSYILKPHQETNGSSKLPYTQWFGLLKNTCTYTRPCSKKDSKLPWLALGLENSYEVSLRQ